MTEVNPRNDQQPRRPSFLPFDDVLANRTDATLLDDLREMLPDTTDDMDDPWEKAARIRESRQALKAVVNLQRVDLGVVDYEQAAADMREWVAQRQEGRAEDRLFLLSHPPVVTYGPRTDPADLPTGMATVEVDRGGHATYHGPGQLVGYLVVNVRQRGPVDIVRWVENGLVDALAALGFATIRRDTPPGATSLVGVWTPDHRKLVSIGMRIRRGVTSHGFAVNVDPDMSVYRDFTACALPGVTMCSLAELAAEQGVPAPTEAAVRDAVATALGAV